LKEAWNPEVAAMGNFTLFRQLYQETRGINPGAEGILKALESLSDPSKKED